ncbi:MAG: hypothetical protein Q8922_10535 [Bacteroidota bacterium]|nr:hypothetical protein [Bacteroidota bacterium]MDP4234561.1 hypothetical protein [Bacteroidota bacterium]MDP4243690.1 hypothetical protein [Bacteroidota bacterium]MDP4288362.1 hypothetical protein [Bacteroidota bacterium]
MRQSFVILLALFTPSLILSSCVGPQDKDTPANAVVRSYVALTNQDSIGYLQSLTRDKRGVYEALPAAAHALLQQWKGEHADVKVLSIQKRNDVATVVYNLRASGPNQIKSDSLIATVYLEGEGWKLGY